MEGAAAELSISPEQTMKVRNSFLHGRVQLLQEHNQKLENYIGQLKSTVSDSCINQSKLSFTMCILYMLGLRVHINTLTWIGVNLCVCPSRM